MRLSHALAVAACLTASAVYAQNGGVSNGRYGSTDNGLVQDDPSVDRQFMRSGRLYGAVSVGAVMAGDAELTSGLGFGDPSNSVEFDTGYGVNGSIGMYLDWFRIEGELSYRSSDVDDWDVSGFINLPVEGELNTFSLMANAYYDLAVTSRTDIYLGAGLGAANVDGKAEYGPLEFSGDDWVVAWQFMTGVAYQVRDNVAVTGGYRLFATEDYDFDDATFDSPLVHSFELGLRFTF